MWDRRCSSRTRHRGKHAAAPTRLETRSAPRDQSPVSAERLPGIGGTRRVCPPVRESPGARSHDCRLWQALTVTEIYPVRDTHGGRPWKTPMTIPEFSTVRQGFTRQGSRQTGRHSVSGDYDVMSQRPRRRFRAVLGEPPTLSSTPNMCRFGRCFFPSPAMDINYSASAPRSAPRRTLALLAGSWRKSISLMKRSPSAAKCPRRGGPAGSSACSWIGLPHRYEAGDACVPVDCCLRQESRFSPLVGGLKR